MRERKEERERRKKRDRGKKEDKTRGKEGSKREGENGRGKREFKVDSQSLWSEPTERMELPSNDTEKTASKTNSLGVANGNPTSIVAWKTPGIEEFDGPQSLGSQRVRHN